LILRALPKGNSNVEPYFPDALEEAITAKVKIYLPKGRPGDWEHTLRVVEFGKILVAREKGNPFFVIPALYLHDIGWSRTYYDDWLSTPFSKQEKCQAALFHQKKGSELAGEILEDLDYQPELALKILEYIEVHDQPERVFALNCLQATLCFEADRLDRFGERGEKRLEAIFNDFQPEERAAFLRHGARQWFKTKTALSLLESLT
jgi:HD superfamily phosphodiesterase